MMECMILSASEATRSRDIDKRNEATHAQKRNCGSSFELFIRDRLAGCKKVEVDATYERLTQYHVVNRETDGGWTTYRVQSG